MDSYVEPVNTNLICCICRYIGQLSVGRADPRRNPFVDPTTATCGHTFCRECIAKALDVAQCCPIDRGALALADLAPAPSLVRNMVDELPVYCPYAAHGCAHVAQRQLMAAHAAQCACAPVACPAGCADRVLRGDSSDPCAHHLAPCAECSEPAAASHTCRMRTTACPHCQTPTPHAHLRAHLCECPASPTPCPLAPYGCPFTGPAHAMATHATHCPLEPLRPFLVLTHSRVTALERTVASLKDQLAAAKRSLGPWFRPPDAPADPEPPRFEFRPLVTRRRVSSPLHTSMFHLDDPAPVQSRRRAGSGSNLRPDDTDPFSHLLPPSPTADTHRTEPIPYIPPLSTHASLEHTLNTLRNSLVSLAASLDMAERRQEVAVTTESLRMHEEVGSMRAIVHGLRMQVSALVMERNVAMIGRMRSSATPTSATSPTPSSDDWATTETRYYNQHPPPPVNLAVPYSIRRQETKL